MRKWALLICLSVLMPAVPATAASRWLAEVDTGAILSRDGGYGFSGLLGGGGRPRSLPFHFFLFGEFSYSFAEDSGQTPLMQLQWRDVRNYTDISLGLRTYLPVVPELRLFFDAQLGGSHVSARLQRQELDVLNATGWAPLGQLSGGLQYRLYPNFSLGVRLRFVLTGDDVAGLRDIVGQTSPIRTAATVSATWHF